MKVRKPSNEPADLWSFGKYINEQAQEAKLAIYYPINGTPARRPLVLRMSEAGSPAKVRRALIDASADIDALGSTPRAQNDELARRLDARNLNFGTYARKMGWMGERFLAPAAQDAGVRDVVIEPRILELAERHQGKSGRHSTWMAAVAKPAEKSSYASFAILMALAAPLLSRVLNGEEGFIINLAGDSSIGKTAALMAGQSLSGQGSALMSWDATTRGLAERAAALSDLFMPIDDLDKINNKSGFGGMFTELTHMLAAGQSRVYSHMVKEELPDLTWSCVAMTGGRTTVERMTKQRRENHERVRCIDVTVPTAQDGGIWDRCDASDVPSRLTDELKTATLTAYGVALPKWLRFIQAKDCFDRARKLLEAWVDGLQLPLDDGLGHRVAKKFGLCRAAGLLAIKARVLPWTEEFVDDVVQALYENARMTLCPRAALVKEGLGKALNAALRDRKRAVTTGKLPKLGASGGRQSFIRRDRPHEWYVTREYFDGLFDDKEVIEEALRKLEDARAITRDTEGKRGRQVRVAVDGVGKRVRMLIINEPKLQALICGAAAF